MEESQATTMKSTIQLGYSMIRVSFPLNISKHRIIIDIDNHLLVIMIVLSYLNSNDDLHGFINVSFILSRCAIYGFFIFILSFFDYFIDRFLKMLQRL